MTRPLSPIERMIDAACGRPPGGKPSPQMITLRCPHCARTKPTTVEPIDPPGTAVIECMCDRCDTGGFKPEVSYYDAQGRQIDIDGNLLTRSPTMPLRVLVCGGKGGRRHG